MWREVSCRNALWRELGGGDANGEKEGESKCGVGCVIEGEEKAGGSGRSSEEQEEQKKMGGEGEELSGGGWRRGWMRISLCGASWEGGGARQLLALHSRRGQHPCSPPQPGTRAGWWGRPGNSAETELWRGQALPQRHCFAPVAGGARKMEGQVCYWCWSPAAG